MGKGLNPADAARKAERKREVAKNKAARSGARSERLFASPAALRDELDKWRSLKPGEKGEDGERLDPASIANRIKKLEEGYAAALRAKREAAEKEAQEASARCALSRLPTCAPHVQQPCSGAHGAAVRARRQRRRGRGRRHARPPAGQRVLSPAAEPIRRAASGPAAALEGGDAQRRRRRAPAGPRRAPGPPGPDAPPAASAASAASAAAQEAATGASAAAAAAAGAGAARARAGCASARARGGR